MERTRWLLLLIGLLVLAGAGCARRDWVSDLLVLSDVTGTWEGSLRPQHYFGGVLVSITMVLEQSGPKVTGEVSRLRFQGQVEGVVNGEVLTLSGRITADLTVDGDEMWARVDHFALSTNLLSPLPACDLTRSHFVRTASPAGAVRPGENRGHALPRTRLALDVLHDRDGTLAHERDAHWMGADAVESGAKSRRWWRSFTPKEERAHD